MITYSFFALIFFLGKEPHGLTVYDTKQECEQKGEHYLSQTVISKYVCKEIKIVEAVDE